MSRNETIKLLDKPLTTMLEQQTLEDQEMGATQGGVPEYGGADLTASNIPMSGRGSSRIEKQDALSSGL